MLGHHNPVLPEQRPKLPEEQARHGVLREGPVERGGAEGGRGGRTCAQRRPDSSPRYEAAAARLIAGTSRVGQRTGGRRSPAMRRARSGRPSSQLGRLVWSLCAPKSTAEKPRTSEGSPVKRHRAVRSHRQKSIARGSQREDARGKGKRVGRELRGRHSTAVAGTFASTSLPRASPRL